MNDGLIAINDSLSLPESELVFRFTTGGGPGGQHVNKTATRVTLIFDIAHSPSLDDETRDRLLERLSSRIDRRGVVRINVHGSRSQWQNRATAIAVFQRLLADALTEQAERRPTRPTRRSREERLARKKQRGAIKQDRRRRWEE